MYEPTTETRDDVGGWCPDAGEETLRGAETILFVEDEAFVREVTCEVLRSAGYRVLTAKNATEAMCYYEACRGAVELLLTDVVLPGETGFALAVRLRRQNPELKVLLVTGYAEQMGRREAKHEECLAKPFSTEALLQSVRDLLDQGKTGSRQAIWSRTPAVTGSVHDLCRNLGKRDNPSKDAQLGAGARHAVDGA